MQKRLASIISLCALLMAFLVLTIYVTAQKEIFFEKQSVKADASEYTISKSAHAQPDMVYAIVIMPKSYRSLLKQFSNHRLARKIQIIPANMVWDDGSMVVQPKASLKKGSQEKPTKSVRPSSIINKSQKQPAGEKNTALDSALMALFLARVSEKRITN